MQLNHITVSLENTRHQNIPLIQDIRNIAADKVFNAIDHLLLDIVINFLLRNACNRISFRLTQVFETHDAPTFKRVLIQSCWDLGVHKVLDRVDV